MHPERFDYSAANCSIARTLDVVGEKWTLLILREAFYGLRRFDDFVRALGCPRDILSTRLKGLVAAGIMSTTPYREPGRRARAEYRLTDKGVDLLPALLALMSWGDRWAADEAGPAVRVVHGDCGAPVAVGVSCENGHRDLPSRELVATPGPGALRV